MLIDEMPGHLFRSLRELLFHPFQFFEGRPEHPRLLPPLLLILGICLVRSAWYSQVLVDYTVRLLEGNSFPTAGFALWSMALLTIGPAIRWVLVTGIVFTISVLFHGKGSFTRLLTFTAYIVIIKQTIIHPVRGIIGILAGRQIMNEISLMMSSGYLSLPDLSTDPTIAAFWMVFWLIGVLSFVWTFIVYVAATQHGRHIPRTHALLTVLLAFACMCGVAWMQVVFVQHLMT